MKESEKDWAQMWKPAKESNISLFKGQFHSFSFKKHSHEDYAIGVIEEGIQQFHLGGTTHVAPAASMITVNPGDVHDGKSAVSTGYRYRVAYITSEMLREILFGLYGNSRRCVSYFKTPVLSDRRISSALLYAHQLMENTQNNLLVAESTLMQVVAEVFLRHGEERSAPRPVLKNIDAVKKSVEYIHKNASVNISLNEISTVAGISPYHFLRQFKATTGLPPHAYLMQCRVYLARRAVDQGHSLITAAFKAGFSDQAHFSRCFKAIHGLSPSRYQNGLRGHVRKHNS